MGVRFDISDEDALEVTMLGNARFHSVLCLTPSQKQLYCMLTDDTCLFHVCEYGSLIYMGLLL